MREGRDGDAHAAALLLDEAELLELRDDERGRLLGRAALGLEPELGARRLLVGIVDPGEVEDLAGVRLRVQTLRVAALALGERRRDVDLDERRVLLGHPARLLPRFLVGRDRGDDDHGAGTCEPGGDPADPGDVLVAVLLREAEALRQPLAHDVAVEPVDERAALLELAGDEPGDRRLTRGREAGEPDHVAAHSATTCSPHSVLALPSQRPSRPAPAFVQCVQPIEE